MIHESQTLNSNSASQNVSSEAQVNKKFFFVEKLCSFLKYIQVFVFLTIS